MDFGHFLILVLLHYAVLSTLYVLSMAFLYVIFGNAFYFLFYYGRQFLKRASQIKKVTFTGCNVPLFPFHNFHVMALDRFCLLLDPEDCLLFLFLFLLFDECFYVKRFSW